MSDKPRLRLSEALQERMHAHLRDRYPEEGCGVLLGHDRGSVREVEQLMPLENQRQDSRANRYLIAPDHLLAAERAAQEGGLDVVGFFHSHPDHPAEPSRFDLEHAWPYYSYLIVSVQSGRVAAQRSWRLAEDRSRFEPEALDVPAGNPT